MGNLLGPDEATRTVTMPGGGSAHGRTATLYTDAAATSLAAILTYSSGTPSTPGSAVSGSQLVIDANSQIPLTWFPAGYDTLYARVNGLSGIRTLRASYDTRLDVLGGDQDLLNGVTTGVFRTNLRRTECTDNLSALTTEVMTSVALPLMAGDLVTNLTFCSATTAANTPTNWWFALYSSAATPALLAQTADQTNTAWAANTPKTVALATPYRVTASGVYYAAIMVKATTPPTLLGANINATASAAVATGQKILARTSGTGLTDTAPATITSATTVGTVPYVVAT